MASHKHYNADSEFKKKKDAERRERGLAHWNKKSDSRFSAKRNFHPMQWTLKQTQIGSRRRRLLQSVLLLTQGGHCCVFTSSRIPLLFWPCQRDNGVQSSAFRWKPVGLKTNPPHIWAFEETVLQGDSCDCCKYHESCLSLYVLSLHLVFGSVCSVRIGQQLTLYDIIILLLFYDVSVI